MISSKLVINKHKFSGENAENTTYNWPITTDWQRNRWYPPSSSANEERKLCTYCPNGVNDNFTCDNDNARKCDNGIVYDTSIFKTSLVIEVNHCFYSFNFQNF
jgi:hypothetical protein